MSAKTDKKFSLSFTPKERKAIKKMFGYGYLQKIVDRLKEKGIKNLSGDYYSVNHVNMGLRSDSVDTHLNKHLWGVIEDRKNEIVQEREKRKQILSDV